VEQVVLTRDQITELIREAVQEAVQETLKSLGVDVEEPFAMQRDMQFLRATREASEAVKRTSVVTMIGAIVLGILGLIWAKLTGSI
jgi:hypothetical protein